MLLALKRLICKSTLFQTISALFHANALLTVVVSCLILLGGFLPVFLIIRMGILVEVVHEAARSELSESDTRVILAAVAWVMALYVLRQIIAPFTSTITMSLGSHFSLFLRETIMKATLEPKGIAHLEDPATLDAISLAAGHEGRAFAPSLMVSALVDMLTARVYGVGAAFLLITFRCWAPFALLLSWAILPGWVFRLTLTQMKRRESASSVLRRSDYSKDLLLRPEPAKEVRLFGLAHWIMDRFVEQRWIGIKEFWREFSRFRWGHLPALLFPAGVSALILGLVVKASLGGAIPLDQFTQYFLAVFGARQFGVTLAWWARSLYGAGSITQVLELPKHTHTAQTHLCGNRPAENLPYRDIRFERVGFTYPGAHQPVFSELNLHIPVGRSISIVGANGAGKTTLVKLLTRLYDPQGGRITIDGGDLRELDAVSWRKQLAVIFQDFICYELSAYDNIAFGALNKRDDTAALQAAAVQAGAAAMVESLPKGWNTMLSRGYEGGVELSGGQWQRIALARALAAVQGGARVLILDEPTANLDVRAEAELFDRFLDLTRSLTTILISHRMSSVRHVNKICVLEGGLVVEEGSHTELIQANGVYAYMFRLQAERFGIS